MPHDLNDLLLRQGGGMRGFAAAGRETGIPKSRLSRRIAELEERLQVRLLHRTTRKLRSRRSANATCSTAATCCWKRRWPNRYRRAERRAAGRLRRTGGHGFEQPADLLPRFLERHPQVQLEILLTNRRVDCPTRVDVALRAWANSATRTLR